MNGYISHYRNGFDGQGLWVEVEVEKEAERLIAGEEGENKKSSVRDVVLAEAVNIAADYVSLFNKKESGKK